MSMKLKTTVPLRIGFMLAIAVLCLGLTQCASNQPITAQYVAQSWYAQSVTVLPIQDPYLSNDVAMDYAERVAERVRQWIPGATVLVDDSMIGKPESEILEYAENGIRTGHYLYGKIWSPRHGRDTYEVEILTRVTGTGREVWSLAANTYNEDPASDAWEGSVSTALDAILERLPDGWLEP